MEWEVQRLAAALHRLNGGDVKGALAFLLDLAMFDMRIGFQHQFRDGVGDSRGASPRLTWDSMIFTVAPRSATIKIARQRGGSGLLGLADEKQMHRFVGGFARRQ